MKILFVAMAATLIIPSITDAQGRRELNACVAQGSRVAPTLQPVDEAARRPDFVVFRRRLQDAVARKDAAAILDVVAFNSPTGERDLCPRSTSEVRSIIGRSSSFTTDVGG